MGMCLTRDGGVAWILFLYFQSRGPPASRRERGVRWPANREGQNWPIRDIVISKAGKRRATGTPARSLRRAVLQQCKASDANCQPVDIEMMHALVQVW